MNIWGDIPSWIEAIAIVYGISAWRNQFAGQRDHDLALKLLKTVNEYKMWLTFVRHPIIYSSEYPIFTNSELMELTERQLRFKKAEYAYENRLKKLSASRLALGDLITEASIIFGDDNIRNIFDKIPPIEHDVRDAVHSYLESINPTTSGTIKEGNFALLYDTQDKNDIIKKRLIEPLAKLNKLLEPKLNLESKWNLLLKKIFFWAYYNRKK